MGTLVVNAGSSNVKLSVVDGAGHRVTASTFDRHGAHLDAETLVRVVEGFGPIDAVGHRIVHGGTDFSEPVLVTPDVVARLDALTPLAPLHQPAGLAGIRAAVEAFPGIANVACFDTAFHATMPAAAATYALPAAWRHRFGLRRYGFHGLSHAWASRRAAAILDRPLPELRMVTCHLGAGASLCAVGGGRSQDTTMGFTPMEGLVMATRSGSVDPGLVLWLIRQANLSADDVADGLEHQSGLAGLSAAGGDIREVMTAAAGGGQDSVLALEVWCHRLCREIGAMAAALGGTDALVFTGGIGEHAPELRARAASRLGFLGVAIDADRNATAHGDADVSAPGAICATVVVTAAEDLEIARQVGDLLGTSATEVT
ncbi:MAG: acetate kinase [Acidimicrobiaceae bacterium]|nr:acetate kinase [Acidimicrobiaceae bacterium]